MDLGSAYFVELASLSWEVTDKQGQIVSGKKQECGRKVICIWVENDASTFTSSLDQKHANGRNPASSNRIAPNRSANCSSRDKQMKELQIPIQLAPLPKNIPSKFDPDVQNR